MVTFAHGQRVGGRDDVGETYGGAEIEPGVCERCKPEEELLAWEPLGWEECGQS